jgi:hypothetical protein
VEGIEDRIMEAVTKHYIQSHDFNGILAVRLREEFNIGEDDLRSLLRELVEEGLVFLAFDRVQGNPHILRIPPPERDRQIQLLASEPLRSFGVYPSQMVLRERPDLTDFSQRPFTQRLALGEAQLTHVFFELSVLEPYYRDPRYHFDYYDLGGRISVRDEAYFSPQMSERDKVVIETFGVAYDGERKRVIVAFLRYLSNLSPEHQQIWQAQIADRECLMNSDYARSSLYGSWPEHYSVYQALLSEIREINKLSALINKPALFRDDFSEERPVQLHPLLRPTGRNFNEFVQFFDKMLSENLNREFFRNDITLEEEIKRQDGKIEVVRIGTLRLLENWLRTHYRTRDGEDVSAEDLEPLKRVRKLRQKPAHEITEDRYDISLAAEQDRVVADVVHALTKMRYILMSHPAAKGEYSPPEWLDSDRIVIY